MSASGAQSYSISRAARVQGSNGKWYLKPLSFALDVYFEPRSAAMPNEPLVSKESTLKRVTFEKDADGKRVSQQPSTITDGDWLVDAIGGCSGVVVIKTGTTKVTPQNKVKLSWTLKKAFLEPSTWGGQGNGGGSDDTTDNVSF